ncbi:MAG: type I-E CRISPR-associated protein Cse1/CasA [Gammaproteobacteria bacterium]|nr:type I-E CRISPR-associated protein Cse1/CasA [Gammaproteobacteria bacterium]MBK7727262.1 type I-E CRISPR-associated protein Cse1/CasA [Gammaproteobacteria bacterium]MBK9665275.1 type I-E CRISPR-associated protein Cse1/CasA [Gammaproteobacteria bacterium]
MNLIDSPWIPVRRKGGAQDWISPLMISDPDIVALDAVRADFNGALAQFLIALVQSTTPMDSLSEWEDLFEVPPDGTTLATWFAPLNAAFEFDGDGPRFMQDLTLERTEALKPIAALLLETPGEQALKFNTDHFVKRDTVAALCLACSAQALLTMQINAPAGGAGHRTSVRGGGPLTTLVVCASPGEATLWKETWLNVRTRSVFLAQGGDPTKTDGKYSFPWLSDISELQSAGGEFSPMQAHPAHVFWGMPRRIRLDAEEGVQGTCDLCTRPSDRLVSRIVTKNYGLNYKGAWNHPLSPYYETKGDAWLPVHPQPGGYGYKHWLPWVLGTTSDGARKRPASVVSDFLTHHHCGGQFRLLAFGYDMDNMKARCWYEATLPIYGLAETDEHAQSIVQAVVAQMVEGASLVTSWLRDAVKQAWFGLRGEVRGDLSYVEAALYATTESGFYTILRDLIESARSGDESDGLADMRRRWRRDLTGAARRLFDERLVGGAPIERQNPHRTAEAYRSLCKRLNGDKLNQVLGLPLSATRNAPSTGKKSKTRENM